jgi:gluconolactonase
LDLSDVIERGEPELVATGFVFTEGPLWHPDGFLYVSDVDARIHYRVDLADGSKEVIRSDSGGANGSAYDLQGRLVTAEQDTRRVVRTESDGSLTVIADRYEGARLNRCNDVVTRSDGSLYFTDPNRMLPGSEREIGSSGIYRIQADGTLEQLVTDMSHPNGIAFSPDESVLYASNSRPDPYLRAYDVAVDGTLSNSRVFAEMPYVPAAPGEMFERGPGDFRPAVERGGVPDGMKVDAEGRIFCTGPRGTWVWQADGAHLGIIETPELPANMGWGDRDLRSLYLTCRTSVFRVRTRTPGTSILGLPYPGG